MPLDTRMAMILDRFSARPALADRHAIPGSNTDRDRLSAEVLGEYQAITYDEVKRRVESVASQLHDPDRLGPESLLKGDRVALLGHPGVDFTTVDLACNLAALTTVPLQTSGSLNQHLEILEETRPRVLAVSIALLAKAQDLIEHAPSLERLLVLDYRGGEVTHREIVQAFRKKSRVAPEFLDLDAAPFSRFPGSGFADDELAMLMYTSGSTGTPKGAMCSARLVAEMWGGEGWSEFFAEDASVASFHYMPMSHVAGHSSVRSTLARGGTTYFASSTNLSSLFEDLSLARPTELSLVPRVCELFRQEFQRRLGGKSAEAQQVFESMRLHLLGGRVRWASCTSAPISAELKAFTEDLLGIEVHELYGTTEIGGVLADGKFLVPPVIDFRLEDVPELGYFRSDRPTARGELLIKSSSTVSGYFNRPELNAEIFTSDGYYRTGDIASVSDDGTVRIIDRKNAIIKLAQGEFVALPSLEAIFAAGSALLHQVFLYGRSDQSSLLAVVVPAAFLRDANATEKGGVDEAALARLLHEELRTVAAQENLNSYEVPAAVLVEFEPFAESNGLLSDHRKPVRPRLNEKYKVRLDALYETLSASHADTLEQLLSTGAERETEETILLAAALSLQIDAANITPNLKFRNLGGDSLTAVNLSRLLEQIYGTPVPVDVLVSDSYTLRDIAAYIDVKRSRAEQVVSFSDVHGSGDGVLRAADLATDKFLSLEEKPTAWAPSNTESEVVLITGASGFLGRFLCIEWLREFAGTGNRVICLIRASTDRAARTRLRETFSTDEELLGEFDALSENLDVIAGDIAEPRLGLTEGGWVQLTETVTRIVHAGAMVNHALPYRELFASNVAGTAEIIRLALTHHMKPLVFMSSIATALLPAEGRTLDESADIRAVLPEVEPTSEVVDGYATTKWAGEVLLREANDRYGLPVTVFRASMILAHSRYAGQINVPDTYTRLLFSLLKTGVAPRSFYSSTEVAAHYDGLPVDVVARSIMALTRDYSAQFRTYHLVNPFDDGVSLDLLVRWIADAGANITWIDSYNEWVERFRISLNALDEKDKRASMLPLLGGFHDPEMPVPGSLIDSSAFRNALLEAGYGDLLAPLRREFVLKTIQDIDYIFETDFLSHALARSS